MAARMILFGVSAPVYVKLSESAYLFVNGRGEGSKNKARQEQDIKSSTGCSWVAGRSATGYRVIQQSQKTELTCIGEEMSTQVEAENRKVKSGCRSLAPGGVCFKFPKRQARGLPFPLGAFPRAGSLREAFRWHMHLKVSKFSCALSRRLAGGSQSHQLPPQPRHQCQYESSNREAEVNSITQASHERYFNRRHDPREIHVCCSRLETVVGATQANQVRGRAILASLRGSVHYLEEVS